MFLKFILFATAILFLPFTAAAIWLSDDKSFFGMSKSAFIGMGLASSMAVLMVSYVYFIVFIFESFFS